MTTPFYAKATPLPFNADALNFTKGGGVVTVVAQDAVSGAVLMLAQANREAIDRTVATGEMHYTSRTRGLWHKGATSGNVQRVLSLAADCDGDAVLARVHPAGPACHTGAISCFGAMALGADAIGALDALIAARVAEVVDTASVSGENAMPTSASYTARLLSDRNLRIKKLGEEMAELVLACADGDATRAADEGADVLYHMMVALRAVGVTARDVREVLDRRSHVQRRP